MRSVRLRWILSLVLVGGALGVGGCIPSTEDVDKIAIGETCKTEAQCAALEAVCSSKVDNEKRCWADGCKEDFECGPRAVCVFVAEDTGDGTPVTPDTGNCYGTCDTVEDCPEAASNSQWFCGVVEGDLFTQGESYCVLEPKPFCGNGELERGEECDDGNYEEGDGCSPECLTEVGCGNGQLDLNIDENGLLWEEECDDDNVEDGDGCSSDCKIEGEGAECGNGILEQGEACDPAAPGWEDGGCTVDCRREDGCGDGEEGPGESCDDGNNVNGDGCNSNCIAEFGCGNGVCEEGNFETCEKCPEDCCPECGDGELQAGEECDDGNNMGGDGCSRGCVDEDGVATCGNGIWEEGEECEDGNTDPADGCAADCTREFVCGDQVCDSDNYETCKLCPEDCCPQCGNGVQELKYGELCDGDALQDLSCEDFCYDGGTLGCTEWCAFDLAGCTGDGPVCGNGVAECDEECDGDDLRGFNCLSAGYAEGSLSCDSNCKFDVSSCGGLIRYFQEDFEWDTVSLWTFTGDWNVGTPSAAQEPDGAFDGNICAGTVIGSDYTDDNEYDDNRLVSPSIDLSNATQPVLTFWHYVQTASSDGGNVRISTNGGGSYTLLDNPDPPYHGEADSVAAYTGEHGTERWQRVLVDLSDYVGESVKFSFNFYSTSYSEDAGWYIDQVGVYEGAYIPVIIITKENLGLSVLGYELSVNLEASGSGNYEWTIEDGTNYAWLTLDPDTGVLSGTPSAGDLGPVSLTIKATEASNPSNFAIKTFTLDVAEALYYESFDAGEPGDWSAAGDWEWGTPTAADGPTGCFLNSSGCYGTIMSGDYNTDNEYDTCTLESPPIDLTAATNPAMTFYHYVDTETSYDGGNLYVSTDGGTTWDFLDNSVVEPDYYDDSTGSTWAWAGHHDNLGWHQVSVDLSAYVGETILVRFGFYSDFTITYPGWFVDQVMIVD